MDLAKKILFLGLFFISFTSIAQDNFTGKVTNSKGDPIIGANILVEESNVITFSDEFGRFYLNAKDSNKDIVISHVGYISNSFKLSNSELEYTFILEDGILLKDQVKVISTRAKENSPYSFSNISRDFIEKNNSGKDIQFLLNLSLIHI